VKNLKSFLLILSFLSVSLIVSAEEAEEGGGKKDRVGPNKAVLAASEKDGLKLSEKAIKNFSLSFKKINSLGEFTVPTSALVQFQDFMAVYRLRDGWFRMVEIEPRVQGAMAVFSTKELIPGDQVVVANGGLIRVVELDIFGPEADACAD
tara:strand:- start:53054 stop:53503 length:450 start_codon:yes stop_codon:yes gene_type:complete